MNRYPLRRQRDLQKCRWHDPRTSSRASSCNYGSRSPKGSRYRAHELSGRETTFSVPWPPPTALVVEFASRYEGWAADPGDWPLYGLREQVALAEDNVQLVLVDIKYTTDRTPHVTVDTDVGTVRVSYNGNYTTKAAAGSTTVVVSSGAKPMDFPSDTVTTADLYKPTRRGLLPGLARLTGQVLGHCRSVDLRPALSDSDMTATSTPRRR